MSLLLILMLLLPGPDVDPGPRVLRIGLIGHRGGQVLHRDLVEVPEPESR